MARTAEFTKWNRAEAYRRLGVQAEIEEYVEYELEHHVRVDVKDEAGRWVEVTT